MTMASTEPAPRLTPVQWTICAVAALGFAFDIYELLMLPLIVRPALEQLVGAKPGTPEFQNWLSMLFYIPALCGGFFGLIGGYLTDRFGRRRVLVWSILLYAFSACGAGFSTSIQMLLVLRCTTFVGVCVEFVAAVAWLAELFPHPGQRERVLGYTQAFSSIGGLLVATANGLAVEYGKHLPAIAGGHEAWRYTLISGVIPAIPLILIRPFLPESPAWKIKSESGTLRRPSIAELFAPAYRRTTVVTTLMFACSYGAAFGAIQHMPQMVPGLKEVKAQTAGLKPPDARKIEQKVAADTNKIQEIGGLVGRCLLAVLAVRIVSRRRLLRVFQWPGLVLIPLIFLFPATTSLEQLKYGMFVAGLLTVAQFSFWGNYLPRVYPIHLRGTGEGFAANIGGRMIGTSAALITTQLVPHMPGGSVPTQFAHAAALVGFAVYLIGSMACFWLPEPHESLMNE